MFQELARFCEVDVTMVVPRAWKGDLISDLRFEPREGDRALRVLPLPVAFSGNGSLFFYRSSLRHVLAGWEPDLVFLDEEPWSLAALQTFLEFPRATIWFFTKENLDKTIPWPFSSLRQWVYRRAAGAFAVSDEVEQVLRLKGFRATIQRLHHSYDPALFNARSEPERQRIRDEFGIPRNTVVIGYFGRLTVEKGLLDLASAVQLMAQDSELPPWFFCCVGAGRAEQATKRALTALPTSKYLMLGAISHDRVGSLLSAIDVLVLPSRTTSRWKEQFGRILVEAMACGAAVVGSDSGEIPHLIRRSGGGLVFREGQVNELAACLVRLLKDPTLLEQYRTEGHRHVEETLTHATVAHELGENLRASIPSKS